MPTQPARKTAHETLETSPLGPIPEVADADTDRPVLLSAEPGVNVRDLVKSRPELRVFYSALTDGDLTSDLVEPGPWTLFAPVDSAFSRLSQVGVASLFQPSNAESLIDLLEHHLVRGRLSFGELVECGQVTSLNGETLMVDGATARIGAARILEVIRGDNGTLVLIDRVLVPARSEAMQLVGPTAFSISQ
jgi:uncharacterized surface protein with fasciclin (FAS1) repeats